MIELNFSNKLLKAKADQFLLTDSKGGFFLYSEKDFSKYQGLFSLNGATPFKYLDSIRVNDIKVNKIVCLGEMYEVQSNKGFQRYFYSKDESALLYQSNITQDAAFIFDCRFAYESSTWGRYYDVSVEDNSIIIKYSKVRDEKSQQDEQEYQFYIAITGDFKKYEQIGKWKEAHYPFDARRNDSTSRAIFEAFSIVPRSVAIACSSFKDDALKRSKQAYLKMEKAKSQAKTNFSELKDLEDKDEIYAYILSKMALKSLTFKRNIYAGLPWFFQSWTRDSALSSKALSTINKDFSKHLLFSLISSIREDGLIPNIYPSSGLNSIDGVGIVFYRIGEILDSLSSGELELLKSRLEKSISGIYKHHSENNLVVNNKFETWMDTIEREGKRIEIQCLFLSMHSLLYKVSTVLKDEKTASYASSQQNIIHKSVKDSFFKEGKLKDGLNDDTVRPNVFLAYYFYPSLLSSKEWEMVFDHVLDKLWLQWGGLSTLDKKADIFQDTHTGVNNMSYHNGDSWYFLNNMAALCLHRLNKEKYSNYIQKIIQSSTNEIINCGIFAFHAELSSAKEQESNGCIAQAWSSALFIELINEINQKAP